MHRYIICLIATLSFGFPILAQQAADTVAPEPAADGVAVASSPQAAQSQAVKAAGRPVHAANWMIAVAHPLAAEAGAEVLRRGGSAADAMVAAQTVLGLVEPQSSGLGGGAFLVWYDAATGQVTTLDARETAPVAATPRLFQSADGEPLKFFEAVVGGRSVGTPGVPALMVEAHRRWGRADWAGLFDDGIRLAEDGFAVSPRLAALIAEDAGRLATFPATAAYFLPGGIPLQAGQMLKNPEYAATLRLLASDGDGAFYALRDGEVGFDIVDAVRGAAGNPGLLSAMDLALYQVRERPPVCTAYRVFQVCGMGPPSSGALAVGQILGILDHFDLATLGPDNPEAWRLIGDASRLAFADRGRYVADSDFVPVPVNGMVDPDYLAGRAELLAGDAALPDVTPGTPKFDHAWLWADDDAFERPSTTHISIVDSYGNALSMTSSIENAFGSRLMVRGFLLNNQLTDFSFSSHEDGVPVANRVEPGKRPRSSMSPTIVLKDGKPVLVVGSPGGSRIIGYVAQAIVAWADWGMDVQQAVAMPHLVNRFGTYDVEAGTAAEPLAPALEALGFKVKLSEMNSGLQAIAIDGGLQGGADPRREGIALGE